MGSDIIAGVTPPTFNAAFALDGEDDIVHFENSGADGRMAMATRPPGAATIENEAADDFTLASQSQITRATFTGLIPV